MIITIGGIIIGTILTITGIITGITTGIITGMVGNNSFYFNLHFIEIII